MRINGELEYRINDIVKYRLQDSTTTREVCNWLENFEANDINYALNVLDKIEYLNENQIVNIYNFYLKRIYSDFNYKNNIFLPLGMPGKSGSIMSYYLRKTKAYNTKKKNKFILGSAYDFNRVIIENDIPKDDFILILLDDFIGSGTSTEEFFKGNKKEKGLIDVLLDNGLKPQICLLSVIVQKEGEERIKKVIPDLKIYGEIRNKAFSSRGSIFGYRSSMLPIREFCFKYGSLLDSTNPLGYSNSQSLVVFNHTIPNNSLPILWSRKNDWYPLFARFDSVYIRNSQSFKNENSYWLSIAYTLGFSNYENDEIKLYKDLDFKLIAIIRLKSMNKSIINICQFLGINLVDFEEAIKIGITRELFNSDGSLSLVGIEMYNEIKKRIAINKRNKKQLNDGFLNVIYLPNQFRGKT